MALRTTLARVASTHAPWMLRLFRAFRSALRNHCLKMDVTFSKIYQNNAWGSAESRSGPGSTNEATRSLRGSLPVLFKELSIRTIVDAPCGDFWMRGAKLDLDLYVGLDVVEQVIDDNNRYYGSPQRHFYKWDLTLKPPPRADLIVCRDLFIHLSYRHIFYVLDNFRRSGSKYLLCSTNPDHRSNHDIRTGGFRELNLRLPPFSLAPPEREIADDPPSDVDPKAAPRRIMALWALQGLRPGGRIPRRPGNLQAG
jgi:hypothetical protein